MRRSRAIVRAIAAGAAAGREILALAESAGADDLVIALFSGGGSALLVVPALGLTLADLQAMTGVLRTHKPGDVVAIRIRRDGAEQVVTVTLGSRGG